MAKEQINGEPGTFRMRAARRRPDFGRDAQANDRAFQRRLAQRSTASAQPVTLSQKGKMPFLQNEPLGVHP
jgi:hypothetical protein